jgi:hypothetical protein
MITVSIPGGQDPVVRRDVSNVTEPFFPFVWFIGGGFPFQGKGPYPSIVRGTRRPKHLHRVNPFAQL